MIESIKTQSPSLAVVAIISSGLSLMFVRSPMFPLAASLGVISGGSLAVAYEGSKSRRQRKLETEEARINELRTNLIEESEALEVKRYSIYEEVEKSALEQVKQQAEIKRVELQHTFEELKAKEKSLQEKEEKLNAVIPNLKAEIEQKQQTAEEEKAQIQTHYESQAQLKESIYRKIAVKHFIENQALKVPDYLEATCTEEYQANEAIKLLLQHGIVAKEPVVQVYDKGFSLSIKILPKLIRKDAVKDGAESDIPFSVAEAGKIIENRLLDALRASIPHCERQPSLDYEFQRLKLKFDLRPVPKSQRIVAKHDEFGISEPDESHFINFVDSCSHLGYCGATGTGKTVALNNTIGAMSQSLGGDIELIVADPKYSKSLKVFKPQYLGARESLLGLRDAVYEMESRIEIKKADYEANYFDREFPKKIYFFDEINEVITLFNNPIVAEDADWLKENGFPTKGTVTSYLLRLWRLGRELGVMTLVAGQNLKPSTLKINVIDLGNFGMIFLGEAMQDGIEYKSVGKEAKDLEEEYLLRRHRAESSGVKAHEFYGLFALPNLKPYFAALPKPETYSLILSGNVIINGEVGGGKESAGGTEGVPSLEIVGRLEALLEMDCSPNGEEKGKGESHPINAQNSEKPPNTKIPPCPKCHSSNTRKKDKGKKPRTIRIQCKDCNKTSTVEIS